MPLSLSAELNYGSSRPFLNYGTAEVFAIVVKIFQKWRQKPLSYFPMQVDVFISKLFSYLFIRNFQSVSKWAKFISFDQ